MFSQLRQRFINRWLVHPPSIWGKLPNQIEYVRHCCSANEAQSWQRWAKEVWLRRTRTTSSQRALKPQQHWVELQAFAAKADMEFVPVTFVLIPGTLDFAPHHFVHGVCVASHDSIGRQCPLIIYQKISPYWMRRILNLHGQKTGRLLLDVASSNAIHKSKPETYFLFWITRVAARVHAADLSVIDLSALVDQMWQQFQPGWMQLVRREAKTISSATLVSLLERYGLSDQTLDTANGLCGVSRLPWMNWPQRLLRKDLPLSAFWQLDMDGGFVNASDNLFSLWRNAL